MFELVTEETYSFTPDDGDEEIHIRSGKLREWLHKHAMNKIANLYFPADQTEDELITQHGLEKPRMESMTEEEAKEPVIVGIWPGATHILIDGAHRRWFWHKRGINTLRGWAVPYEIWKQFTYDPDDLIYQRQHNDGSLLPQRRGKNNG